MKMTVMEISEKLANMAKEEKDINKLKAYADVLDYMMEFESDDFDTRHLFELCEELARIWPEYVGAQIAMGILTAVNAPEKLMDVGNAEIDINGV